MASWLKKKLGFSCFKMPRNSETMGKHTLKNQLLSQLMIKQLNSDAVSSLFLYQAYTPCEGLIGNISLKVMTHAPYCAQFTHHDREQNIFLSHNPYLSQQAFYHMSVLLSLSSYPLAFFHSAYLAKSLSQPYQPHCTKPSHKNFFITFYNKSARRTVCII